MEVLTKYKLVQNKVFEGLILIFCFNLFPQLLNLFFFLTAEMDMKKLGSPIFPTPHCTPFTLFQ